jgi:hypothetical protein
MNVRLPVAAIAAASLLGCGLAGAIPAEATPLAITESTDFSNTPTGAVIGTLDVGVNTVSGHVASISDPADYFELVIPAQMTVTHFQVNVSNITHELDYTIPDGGIDTQALGGGSYDTNGPFTTELIPPTSLYNLTSFFVSFDTIMSGPVTFFEGFVSDIFTNPGDLTVTLEPSFDYALSYTVESTATGTAPEPATLALLGLGFAGIAVSRKRIRQ